MKALDRLTGTAVERLARHPVLFGQVQLLLRWSAIICLAGFFATVAKKLGWALDAREWADLGVGRMVWLLGWDMVVFIGLISLTAAVEQRWRWSAVLTLPLCAAVSFLGMINALWLEGTGGQLAASVFTLGFGAADQNLAVGVEAVGPLNVVLFALTYGLVPIVVGVAAIPLRRAMRGHAVPRRHLAPLIPLALTAAAVALVLLAPRHQSPAVRSMARNVQISMAAGLYRAGTAVKSTDLGFSWLPVVAPPRDDRPATRDARDVIIVMLESANWARSSFGDPEADRSPYLKALAGRGLLASSMRAVIPHSTKSLFTIHCGSYPDMQRAIVETADNFPNNCLPRLLEDRGWASAFFQSAAGAFEQRPRLVHRLGFSEFFPRETLHAEKTTVINGDDFAMLAPGLAWMKRQRAAGRPFIATFFTSLQHVNYSLPPRLGGKRECRDGKRACERQAYEEIYRSGTDAFLEQLVAGLEGEDLLSGAVLVASGDHGEAFGEHGLYSHDNVYYEEGLHVPLVIVAPGLIPPGTVNDEHRSMTDVYPTILELLDIEYDPGSLDAVSLLQRQPSETKRYFRCWYDGYCEGYVRGTEKVVRIPQESTWFRFDLAADPGETASFIEEEELAADIDKLSQWMGFRVDLVEQPEWEPKRLYHIWDCKSAKGGCRFDSEAYAEHARSRFEVGPGDGLRGTYFADAGFAQAVMERRDPIVDFFWPAKESPHEEIPSENFAIRWEGCLRVEPGEAPRLAAGADTAIKVFVADRLVIDRRVKRTFEWAFATDPLEPGLHPLRVDFSQGKGDAQAVLGWLTAEGQALPDVVPPARLVPPGTGDCPAAP